MLKIKTLRAKVLVGVRKCRAPDARSFLGKRRIPESWSLYGTNFSLCIRQQSKSGCTANSRAVRAAAELNEESDGCNTFGEIVRAARLSSGVIGFLPRIANVWSSRWSS